MYEWHFYRGVGAVRGTITLFWPLVHPTVGFVYCDSNFLQFLFFGNANLCDVLWIIIWTVHLSVCLISWNTVTVDWVSAFGKRTALLLFCIPWFFLTFVPNAYTKIWDEFNFIKNSSNFFAQCLSDFHLNFLI